MDETGAIGRLVEGHRQFLAFVERRVESRAAAEDILQSAFVKGLERSADLREEESVVAWFYRILRNSITDHYRSRDAARRVTEAWERDAPSSVTSQLEQEICGCLMPVLDALKPEYRQALELVDLQDASLTELASQAGITARNAAVRIHRARAALRKQVRIACGTCAEHGCLDCRCQACAPGTTTAEAQ